RHDGMQQPLPLMHREIRIRRDGIVARVSKPAEVDDLEVGYSRRDTEMHWRRFQPAIGRHGDARAVKPCGVLGFELYHRFIRAMPKRVRVLGDADFRSEPDAAPVAESHE